MWMCILLVGVFVVTASTATFTLTSQRPWQGAWPLDTTEARAYVSVTTNQTPRKPQTPETPAQDHFATSKSKSKSESKSDADMLSGIEAKEQELCAREDKELKSMDPDGRCGWYMAAELLYGTTRQWADAKKLLVDIAAGDYKLFLELRTMNVEERLDYCKALRSNEADANQYFDLTMLRALAWCIGMPVKVLSTDPAYDGEVYGTEYARALREAAGQAVPAPVCVVCACLSRCGQRLADLGQFYCLHRAASHSGCIHSLSRYRPRIEGLCSAHWNLAVERLSGVNPGTRYQIGPKHPQRVAARVALDRQVREPAALRVQTASRRYLAAVLSRRLRKEKEERKAALRLQTYGRHFLAAVLSRRLRKEKEERKAALRFQA